MQLNNAIKMLSEAADGGKIHDNSVEIWAQIGDHTVSFLATDDSHADCFCVRRIGKAQGSFRDTLTQAIRAARAR